MPLLPPVTSATLPDTSKRLWIAVSDMVIQQIDSVSFDRTVLRLVYMKAKSSGIQSTIAVPRPGRTGPTVGSGIGDADSGAEAALEKVNTSSCGPWQTASETPATIFLLG